MLLAVILLFHFILNPIERFSSFDRNSYYSINLPRLIATIYSIMDVIISHGRVNESDAVI